ncbi:MAG: sensor histidine kinase [Flavobacteriaceae bacterium]|nr:sensor histidine kinase [Flavobacteriaceae bacterium]
MSNKTINILKKRLVNLLSKSPIDFAKITLISNELIKLDPNFQRFSVDARTIIHLGRDSIKDHSTALLELVKNSYDADAENVDVEVYSKTKDLIRVSDNGFGMTEIELKNNWLRIGFSKKRESKISQTGRRHTGEKGIGRISTDRLGSKLELRTKSKDDKLIGLKLNWDDFDVEGINMSDIKVEIFEPKEIDLPKKDGKISETGTEIIITKQRQPWNKRNIENLYTELSALTPPYTGISDFSINLNNDISPNISKKIDANFLKASEIELEAFYDGKGDEIIYTIRDKYNDEDVIETVKWKNLITKSNLETISNVSDKLKCGPVTLKLSFFLREAASVDDMDFKLKELREFLDNNAGIKIYRDRIVVKPYGFPSSQFGYDWLNLANRKAKDPAGIGRAKQYKVTPNQIVGAAFITRDSNISLTDSAAREGLVESEGFYDLKYLILGSINMLESYRVKILPEINKARKSKRRAERKTDKIIRTLNKIETDLIRIKKEVENAKDIKDEIKTSFNDNIIVLSRTSDDVEKTITELLNWNRTLSGLATIGISSAVFAHETEGSIKQFKGSAKTAKLLLERKQPAISDAKLELSKAIKYSKKVAAWGAYALTRVQKEKRNRKDINVKTIINNVINELKPAFKAASIDLKFNTHESVYSYTYQMDIETILINLLTNSYTATTQKSGNRVVEVTLSRENLKETKTAFTKGFSLIVSDSGHGVAKEFSHRIFEPLFSTKISATQGSKSVGTGLGLTVLSSIVKELKGLVFFDKDPILKGARFKIWLPIDRKK